MWIDVERAHWLPADVALFSKAEPVYVSPVTLAELRFGAETAMDATIRQKRLAAACHRLNENLCSR